MNHVCIKPCCMSSSWNFHLRLGTTTQPCYQCSPVATCDSVVEQFPIVRNYKLFNYKSTLVKGWGGPKMLILLMDVHFYSTFLSCCALQHMTDLLIGSDTALPVIFFMLIHSHIQSHVGEAAIRNFLGFSIVLKCTARDWTKTYSTVWAKTPSVMDSWSLEILYLFSLSQEKHFKKLWCQCKNQLRNMQVLQVGETHYPASKPRS